MLLLLHGVHRSMYQLGAVCSHIFWLWSSILNDKRKPMLSKIIFGMLIFVAKYLNKSIPLLLEGPENQM